MLPKVKAVLNSDMIALSTPFHLDDRDRGNSYPFPFATVPSDLDDE